MIGFDSPSKPLNQNTHAPPDLATRRGWLQQQQARGGWCSSRARRAGSGRAWRWRRRRPGVQHSTWCVGLCISIQIKKNKNKSNQHAQRTHRSTNTPTNQHLIARSEAGLAETRQAAEAGVAAAKGSGDGGLRVWTWPLDLGDLDALPARLDAVFATVSLVESTRPAGRIDREDSRPYPYPYIRTHRWPRRLRRPRPATKGPTSSTMRASWGPSPMHRSALHTTPPPLTCLPNSTPPTPTAQQDLRRDWPAVRRAVDVNVTSFVYLTALFLEAFGPRRGGRDLPAAAAPAPGAAVSPNMRRWTDGWITVAVDGRIETDVCFHPCGRRSAPAAPWS